MARSQYVRSVIGLLAAIAVVAWLPGCGGAGGEVDLQAVGGWFSAGSLLVITAGGQYAMREAEGYWEQGSIEFSGGRFTVRTEDSSDADLVGTTTTGSYSVAGGNLTIDPDDGSPMVFAALPPGGPVADRAVGVWKSGNTVMAIHKGGYFIFANDTQWRLGNIAVGVGTFTVTVRAGSEAGEIGQSISGTYTLVGSTLTITPEGQAPIVLNLEE